MTRQTVSAERDAFLDLICSRIADDSRMRALWLVGSMGRGDHVDEWSDIDLLLVVDDAALEPWVLARESELGAFGQLLLRWDAPQNAWQPGYMLCSIFDSSVAPMWVDWLLQPLSHAVRPADSRILWERTPLPVSAQTFTESLAGVWEDDGQPSLRHLADHDEWRGQVGMAYLALKKLARSSYATGDDDRTTSDAHIRDVLARVEGVFAQHADHLPARLRELLAARVEHVGAQVRAARLDNSRLHPATRCARGG